MESLLIPKEEAEKRMLDAILGNEEGSQAEKQSSTKSDTNSGHNSIRFTGTQEYEDY